MPGIAARNSVSWVEMVSGQVSESEDEVGPCLRPELPTANESLVFTSPNNSVMFVPEKEKVNLVRGGCEQETTGRQEGRITGLFFRG